MARLRTLGAEWNSAAADFGQAATSTLTAQSSVVRSGTYAFALAPDGSTIAGVRVPFTATTGRHYYYRAYVRFTANPARAMRLFGWSEGSNTLITTVTLSTSGQIGVADNTGGGIGSSFSASTGTWYRVELDTFVPNSAGVTTVELRVDGTSIASGNITRTNNAPAEMYVGDTNSATSLSATVYLDDIAVNDDQGSFQNSWPGSGKVVLLIPTADNQRGSWTGGVGGTTNLFDALNNLPPTGTATETDSTQIESADTSPDNSTDEYRGTMTTYTAAGVGSSDTLVSGQAHVWHGEDVAAGTKTGSLSLLSNPASGVYSTFTYGDNIGALGTWPTNWRLAWQNGVDISGATKGTAPVVALRKTDTGSAVASACALGIYAEYIPVTNTTVTPPTATLTTTTFAPTVTATDNKTATAGLATLSLATFAPVVSVSDNKTATAGLATLTLTTFAPVVTATDLKTATPGTAALSLTTFAPTVSISDNKTATIGLATLTTTAFAPVVTATANVTATPGLATLTLTTYAPTVSVSDNQLVTPGTASLSVTAFTPVVTATANVTVTPGVAALSLTAFAPTVTATTVTDTTVTPGTASLTLTTFAPTVTASDHKTVTPGTASLSLTAFAPTTVLSDQKVFTPATRALVLTTFAPTVHATANVVATPATRALHLTTFAPHAVTPRPGRHLDLAMSIQDMNVDNAAALLRVSQSAENVGPTTSKDDMRTTLTMGDTMTVDLSYE